MTYNQLFNAVYGEGGNAVLAQQDEHTRKAWAAFRALSARKGFDWWFDDLDTTLKNGIFNDVRKAIAKA